MIVRRENVWEEGTVCACRQLVATFIWITAVRIKVILKLPGVSNLRHDKSP
jgi:hypothetical protein